MDITTVVVVAIIAAVVLVALLLFRRVNFEAALKGWGKVKLGASNEKPSVEHNISVSELEARKGHIKAATEGNITGRKWTAATDVDLVAGRPRDPEANPKAVPPPR